MLYCTRHQQWQEESTVRLYLLFGSLCVRKGHTTDRSSKKIRHAYKNVQRFIQCMQYQPMASQRIHMSLSKPRKHLTLSFSLFKSFSWHQHLQDEQKAIPDWENEHRDRDEIPFPDTQRAFPPAPSRQKHRMMDLVLSTSRYKELSATVRGEKNLKQTSLFFSFSSSSAVTGEFLFLFL